MIGGECEQGSSDTLNNKLSASSCVEEQSVGTSWIRRIEELLFNDEDEKLPSNVVVVQDEDDFFADLDLPIYNRSPESNYNVAVEQDVTNCNLDKENKQEDDLFLDVGQFLQDDDDENNETCTPQSHLSSNSEVKDDQDDPITKKRQRQMRNRDAAVRSRERKKIHVKDLEVKTKYLELECIRLQRLLHCCAAQNHALHLQLQDKPFTASTTKQESAVLLLESLLLGSLLWFLVVAGLFSPLALHQLPAEMLVNVGRDNLKVVDLVAPGRARSKKGLGTLRLLFKSKRCKGSRSRIKAASCYGVVA